MPRVWEFLKSCILRGRKAAPADKDRAGGHILKCDRVKYPGKN